MRDTPLLRPNLHFLPYRNILRLLHGQALSICVSEPNLKDPMEDRLAWILAHDNRDNMGEGTFMRSCGGCVLCFTLVHIKLLQCGWLPVVMLSVPSFLRLPLTLMQYLYDLPEAQI